MRPADRRSGIRFPLQLRCRVVFPFKSQCNFEGITENLSRDGVLIRVRKDRIAEAGLRVGDWVRILLELPLIPNLPQRSLGCEATLTRITEDGPDTIYLAFQIDQMEFCDSETGRAAGNAKLAQVAFSGIVN
jgi:PilZ domain